MKLISIIALPFMVMLLLCSCGGATSQPEYALGKGSIFTSQDKGETLFGKYSFPENVRTLGYDEVNRTLKIQGFDISIDGKVFCIVSKSYAPTNTLITKDIYKLHALVKQAGKDNPYFKEGEYYSDAYYFVDPAELEAAITTFNSTPKTKVGSSNLKAGDYDGGVNALSSKIVAVVKYIGFLDMEEHEFASLYLESGDIVRQKGNGIYSYNVGDTIDCVVDKTNDILEYRIL